MDRSFSPARGGSRFYRGNVSESAVLLPSPLYRRLVLVAFVVIAVGDSSCRRPLRHAMPIDFRIPRMSSSAIVATRDGQGPKTIGESARACHG
jgi:hypothetical protein